MFAARIIRRVILNRQGWIAASVLALGLTLLESLSYGVGPKPSCPCAADGICRPNRAAWGYSQTRWRAWPGDQTGQLPTSVDGASAGAGDESLLPPYEAPLPEDEDLRGPAKGKTDESTDDEAAGEEPAILLPGPDAGAGFDPQGNRFEVPQSAPQMEDAPPPLPASLRQAAESINTPPLTHRQQPRAVQPAAATSSLSIRPVSWQQPAIGLINPATAVAQPAANTLRQAIYYEASDLADRSAE